MPFHVYILQSLKDGNYYIGSTNNLEDRVERHNQGRSQYTKFRSPWKLVYSEEYPDRSSAERRENGIKRKKKKGYIESLIRPSLPYGREGRELVRLRRIPRLKAGSPPVV
jgi:putative endonuclease